MNQPRTRRVQARLRPCSLIAIRPPARSARLVIVVFALVLLTTALVGPNAVSAQTEAEDPGLVQTIDADEPVVAGPASIASGHVDIGPRYLDGTWTLLVHDDSTDAAVWRSLDETVLRVGDAALLTVPDDPTYAFIGAPAGTDVHVIPQTQNPDVVWLGWNTQDPEVMETIDRGATLTLHDVEGPGEVTMYLQSGTLGDPEVLWSSTTTDPQPIWVDVNTHTHANWVFTEPGVYLVQVELAADLVTGEKVSDVRTLRFAVGDATTDAAALAASPSGTVAASSGEAIGAAVDTDVAANASSGAAGDDGDGAILIVGAVVGALLLAGAVAVVALRGQRARRAAFGAGPEVRS